MDMKKAPPAKPGPSISSFSTAPNRVPTANHVAKGPLKGHTSRTAR